jgi:branched-chain amino acid transport system ATP-binding protein
MLSIGRGLIVLPRLLVPDEPSLRLVLLLVKEIFDTIVELNKKEHLTIFLVEQNLRTSLRMLRRGYVLENNRIVLEGRGRELLENEYTKKAYLGL